MRKKLTKRIMAYIMCLLMVITIMPDTAVAAKKADTVSSLNTITYNTISILGNIIQVPQCDETSWKVENANFIVASKTNSEKDKGFIVWTVNELNDKAKADIIKAIGQKSTWADFKKLDDGKLPVTFAYGDTSKLPGLIKNAVVKPVGEDIQIDFSAEKVWTKYMYGTYIYTPKPTTVELAAEKAFLDEEQKPMALNGGEFTFVLKGGEKDAYATNDNNGDISFTIAYDKPGEYEYTIMEVNGKQPGYSYDDKKELKYKVKVDDVEGELSAKVIESPKEVVFTNTYTKPVITPADAAITATKNLSGKALTPKQFTFLLYSGKTVDEDNFLGSATNGDEGAISFTRTFTEAGEYYFTVAEANTGKTGYAYDNNVFTYKVTVTGKATLVDNKEIINLEAKVDLVEADKAVFTNSYKPLPTTAVITADKELKDAEGNAMELTADQFEFQLKNGAGEVIETVGNAIDGSIAFSEITYDRAGTYKYTVNEVIPEVKADGYTYDESKFEYTVVVEDVDGQLVAEVNAPEDITFNNIYELEEIPDNPPPLSSGGITASKELKDSDGNVMNLTASQFKFQLKDEAGKVVETVGNAADGKIVFSPIEYELAGTYIYTVNEVIPEVKEEGYTYDESVFEYKVVVEEMDGYLVAKVTVPEDTTFNNTYVLEEIPDDPPPKTGDASNNGAYMMSALATLCAAAFIISRKRRQA